jgi:hypothetical protein
LILPQGVCDEVNGGCLCEAGHSGEACEVPCPAVYIDEKKGMKYCLIGSDENVEEIQIKRGRPINAYCQIVPNNQEADDNNLCPNLGPSYIKGQPMLPAKARKEWEQIWKDKFGELWTPRNAELNFWEKDDCQKMFGVGFEELDCNDFPQG